MSLREPEVTPEPIQGEPEVTPEPGVTYTASIIMLTSTTERPAGRHGQEPPTLPHDRTCIPGPPLYDLEPGFDCVSWWGGCRPQALSIHVLAGWK